jgi:tRNA/tmRNA/rRNA uracil-C5-methylase (TrmA/RlmC/RlmD family)
MGGVLAPVTAVDQALTEALKAKWQLSEVDSVQDWALQWEHGVLKLLTPGITPLTLGYHEAEWTQLARSVKRKLPALAKAIGGPLSKQRVLDLTLGFGHDAFILSQLGATVLGVEQHVAVAAMVFEALTKHAYFSMVQGDSMTQLSDLVASFSPTVIYIDPMFPPRKKQALVQKRMQVLQHLHRQEVDHLPLIALALTKGLKVVVKQPLQSTLPFESHYVLRQKSMQLIVI